MQQSVIVLWCFVLQTSPHFDCMVYTHFPPAEGNEVTLLHNANKDTLRNFCQHFHLGMLQANYESTQPCTPPGSLNRVAASAGV